MIMMSQRLEDLSQINDSLHCTFVCRPDGAKGFIVCHISAPSATWTNEEVLE